MARRGFTLIELLIVVAIIAILALIAVPNFLEAQTRAKVSRVKADMRSLATAEEAYMVDWNSYTFGVMGTEVVPLEWGGFTCLTTPVAYITSLPLDPFGWTRFNGALRLNTFEFGVGIAGVPGGAPRTWADFRANPNQGMPSNTYEMESDGPDHNDNTGGPGPAPSTGSYPWATSTDPNSVVNAIYDPTNGTVSAGDIFRPGGLKPPGAANSILFDLCSTK